VKLPAVPVFIAISPSIGPQVKLPAVPVFIAITGLLDVEYRVVVAARDGNLYTIKNGEITGMAIELESQPCGLVRTNKNIIVGCMNNTIHSFHVKGKKSYSIYLPSTIVTMELLQIQRQRMTKALLVALANGEVRDTYQPSNIQRICNI
jgi:Bardet-Biedl syndrome 1 protein